MHIKSAIKATLVLLPLAVSINTGHTQGTKPEPKRLPDQRDWLSESLKIEMIWGIKACGSNEDGQDANENGHESGGSPGSEGGNGGGGGGGSGGTG